MFFNTQSELLFSLRKLNEFKSGTQRQTDRRLIVHSNEKVCCLRAIFRASRKYFARNWIFPSTLPPLSSSLAQFWVKKIMLPPYFNVFDQTAVPPFSVLLSYWKDGETRRIESSKWTCRTGKPAKTGIKTMPSISNNVSGTGSWQ